MEDPWRIRGSGKLNRRGLAALRALWTWRDDEASKMDRPSFMVCSNDDLLRWSEMLQEFRVVEPRNRMHAQRASRLRKTIERFQLLDEHDYPCIPKRVRHEQDPHFEMHMAHWSAKRDTIAEQLDIEPSLIASRIQLETISNHEDAGLAALMNWQRDLLTR